MKTVSMSGSLRENVGKKDAKKNRREGKVPCVLYGGNDQIHLTIEDKAFTKIIFTPEIYILKLNIEGKEYDAILQDIQYHPVTDRILHADFLELISGKPITIGIPVRIEGNAPGVLQGGNLFNPIRILKVRGLAEDVPDNLVLNIDKLDIGDSIRVKDIDIENVTLLDYPNSQVVAVKTARGAGMEEEEVEEEEVEEGVEGAAKEGAEGAEGEATPAAEGGEQKKKE
ncbi:MAG: 50S ribosomal protein L25/general stress protein Ctc [Bacteroidales bacterium]|nr:50S ribosomal protein L25/general stress protein Ctc [Bacteroidales bacterium]